jgi:hypothetical protein
MIRGSQPDGYSDHSDRATDPEQKTGAEFVGYIELAHHNGQSKSEQWKVSRENWLGRGPTSSP